MLYPDDALDTEPVLLCQELCVIGLETFTAVLAVVDVVMAMVVCGVPDTCDGPRRPARI